MQFKNSTEKNTFSWLLTHFDSNQISQPDQENTNTRRPDFSVNIDDNQKLIIECKGIEKKILDEYRIRKTEKNISGKFEQYAQLKPIHYGKKTDIRVLIVGGEPTYEDNSFNVVDRKFPPRINFLMDSIYGTFTEFTMYKDSRTSYQHIGTMNIIPRYISAVGFLGLRVKNGYNEKEHLYLRLFLNTHAETLFDSEILKGPKNFDQLVW